MKILYIYTERLGQLGDAKWYLDLGVEVSFLASTRQLNQAIKKQPPDWLMADFIYGYGNNYAGANVSNLDVSLSTLERYAPSCKVIVLAIKEEMAYVEKLEKLFKVDVILPVPFSADQLKHVLQPQ